MESKKNLYILTILFLFVFAGTSFADQLAVQNSDNTIRKITGNPAEKLFMKRTESKDSLLTNLTVGVTQGLDSNPNLDSTHKVDSYTEEDLNMAFRYPIPMSKSGKTEARFGFDMSNVTYYRVTDDSTFDGIGYINFDHQFSKTITGSVGYSFEWFNFPCNEKGTYVGNEVNASLRQKLNDVLYQKVTYHFIVRNYTQSKVMLGNGTFSSDLRVDMRNQVDHELGIYIGKNTKLRLINQYYFNSSNYQFYDFYTYNVYKTGGSITQMIRKKFYNVTGLYYQRKEYESRVVSDRLRTQDDNMYILSTTFMYDLSKNISFFANYSFRDNHTNEPLERYSDSIYTAGMYYSF